MHSVSLYLGNSESEFAYEQASNCTHTQFEDALTRILPQFLLSRILIFWSHLCLPNTVHMTPETDLTVDRALIDLQSLALGEIKYTTHSEGC